MTTRSEATYAISDRVVVTYPGPRPFLAVVREVLRDGDMMASAGDGVFRVSLSEVRPAMPRDRHDLERWGRWWWRNERPVWVTWTLRGVVWSPSPAWREGLAVDPSDDWSGPVAPPPEVRS